MKNKFVFAAAVFVLAAGLLFAVLRKTAFTAGGSDARQSAVAMPVSGKQVVEVNVKEGYQPREIAAKAGVPLLLKLKTQGAFDCSTAFSIPKLGLGAQMPPNGETTLEIPPQKAGDTLTGVCRMGMYSLVIRFS